MTTSESKATDAAPTIEPATADALSYVLHSWGKEMEWLLWGDAARRANPHCVKIGFLKAFAPIQARIVRRSKVLTAMKAGRIAGFIVYEPAFITVSEVDRDTKSITFGGPTSSGVLHWILTRQSEQRQGIGRALLNAAALVHPEVSYWSPSLRFVGLADAPQTPFWLRSL